MITFFPFGTNIVPIFYEHLALRKNTMKKPALTYKDYFKEQLDQDGIAIIENNIPIERLSYVTLCLMIALHKQGELHVQYDLQDKVFSERKIVILLPDHMVTNYWSSEDFQRTLILISPQVFEQLRHTVSFRNHILYHNEPECELTEEQWDSLLPCTQLLRTIVQSTSPNRQQMLVNYLDILFELLNSYNIVNRGKMFSDDSNRQLFTRFYELLIEHYRDSRDIKYYADYLCLTPKYFAKLIKQATGISASEWIDNYVMMQAKTLLQGYPQYSIQQISDKMGFTEQSTFCRYFRVHEGISPCEFRKQLN